MDLDIYQPETNPEPPNNPPNPPKPDLPNPNPPNPGPKPKPSPGTIGGNDQLYRDQMYIRDTLSYVPTTDPETNTTTTPPEMPEWTLDTDLISNLLTPIAIAGGLALAFFGEGKKFTNPAQNFIGELAKMSKYGPKDVALFILSYALFFVDPGLGSYVMLIYQSLAFSAFIFGIAEIVVKSTQNEFFLILSSIMLLVSLAIIIRDLIEHKLHGPVGDWLEDMLQNLINRFGRK